MMGLVDYGSDSESDKEENKGNGKSNIIGKEVDRTIFIDSANFQFCSSIEVSDSAADNHKLLNFSTSNASMEGELEDMVKPKNWERRLAKKERKLMKRVLLTYHYTVRFLNATLIVLCLALDLIHHVLTYFNIQIKVLDEKEGDETMDFFGLSSTSGTKPTSLEQVSMIPSTCIAETLGPNVKTEDYIHPSQMWNFADSSVGHVIGSDKQIGPQYPDYDNTQHGSNRLDMAGISSSIVDVRVDDALDEDVRSTLLKNINSKQLAKQAMAPLPKSKTIKDQAAKRKHQITYLANLAVAREEALQEQWAENRQMKKMAKQNTDNAEERNELPVCTPMDGENDVGKASLSHYCLVFLISVRAQAFLLWYVRAVNKHGGSKAIEEAEKILDEEDDNSKCILVNR
uniref:BZIP domain-containing protein n=1 Tax=Heterorhabditis bacteriophora TaxID=37862 RepID=A0A1I7XJH9_HETBA